MRNWTKPKTSSNTVSTHLNKHQGRGKSTLIENVASNGANLSSNNLQWRKIEQIQKNETEERFNNYKIYEIWWRNKKKDQERFRKQMQLGTDNKLEYALQSKLTCK